MKYLLVWKFKDQPANSMVFTNYQKLVNMYKYLIHHNVTNQLHGEINAFERTRPAGSEQIHYTEMWIPS